MWVVKEFCVIGWHLEGLTLDSVYHESINLYEITLVPLHLWKNLSQEKKADRWAFIRFCRERFVGTSFKGSSTSNPSPILHQYRTWNIESNIPNKTNSRCCLLLALPFLDFLHLHSIPHRFLLFHFSYLINLYLLWILSDLSNPIWK